MPRPGKFYLNRVLRKCKEYSDTLRHTRVSLAAPFDWRPTWFRAVWENYLHEGVVFRYASFDP